MPLIWACDLNKTSTERTSVWAQSENKIGSQGKPEARLDFGVYTSRPTPVEVLGLPPSQTKTFLRATPHRLHSAKTKSFWLQVGQQKECGHMPNMDK
ncbi:hypothetical protein VZT92_027616 [Zoarces viviparus]|uniref:Uncharacterized protein n=1 Tax=Zoarces viviparus TaxID=48416 RepID=A0AAW1DVE7_ZOAVI